MNKVTIYGTDTCSFCIMAKALAKGRGDSLLFRDVSKEADPKEFLSDLFNQPITTIPQIIVNGKHVGGYSEYKDIHGSSKSNKV